MPTLVSLTAVAALLAVQEKVVDGAMHHLGDDETPDWTEAPARPEGDHLEWRFPSTANPEERILLYAERHVSNRWTLSLNGKEIATLPRSGDEVVEHYLVLPPGSLVDGENVLELVTETPSDDITFGRLRLVDRTLREHFDLRPVRVTVRDADTDAHVPARLTIVDPEGEHVPVFYGESDTTAVREGVVYTSDGRASFEVPAGEYRLYATRGMEWSLAEAPLVTDPEQAEVVFLELRHEVDTPGFVAADTHVHTLTFSGHGDSSVEERLVTLAGEGVELAIATDHNHNTDYGPLQHELELNAYFTPVTGNEVTTPLGHFNAFPLDPEDEVPEHDLHDWVKLVDGMREKGAKVVILNHPRWPEHDTGPFGVFELDRKSGRRESGGPFTFDAMELVNSTTEEEDPFFLLQDWFALRNHGVPISMVGSSDSHTVGDPVGQGRTYVKSTASEPGAIDVDEACASFLAGSTSVAQGIFTDILVDERARLGETLVPNGKTVRVDLRVASPSWIRPRVARVYFNGSLVAEMAVPLAGEGKPTDVTLTFHLPRPEHDVYLVCVVTGPGVEGPWWRTKNPYTLGATNPVYLDVDGTEGWSSPHETAETLLASVGTEPDRLREALATCDDAIAVQALDLAYDAYLREARAKLERAAGERAAEITPRPSPEASPVR